MIWLYFNDIDLYHYKKINAIQTYRKLISIKIMKKISIRQNKEQGILRKSFVFINICILFVVLKKQKLFFIKIFFAVDNINKTNKVENVIGQLFFSLFVALMKLFFVSYVTLIKQTTQQVWQPK